MTASNSTAKYRLVRNILLVLVLSTLYFGLRIHNSATVVTNDEPFWLGRSANFQRAIAQWEPQYTYQMAHPGVPVMWAGAIAYWIVEPDFANDGMGNIEHPFFVGDRLMEQGKNPMDVLQVARAIKLAFETVLFAGALILLTQLASHRITFLAGTLISLDPFVAGFGPLLHVDSLFAMSIFTATLAICWSIHRARSGHYFWIPFVVAGILAAIAALTRATGAVLILGLLLGLFQMYRSHPGPETRSSAIRGLAAWTVAAIGTGLVLWPALWSAPVDTIGGILSWSIGAASGGHEHPLFYRGEIHHEDPGFGFYPYTVLWRTSPIVWLGIGATLVSLGSAQSRERIRPLVPAIFVAAVFFLAMSFGSKKFDRYILAIYPVISLLAALGLDAILQWLSNRLPKFQQLVAPIGVAIISILAIGSFANAGPYRLNYYNPIVNVFTHPEDSIQIGWGEGGNEVIAYLHTESSRMRRSVVAQVFAIPQESIPPTLKYFLVEDGEMTDAVKFQNVGLTTPEDWQSTDFIVFNIQQTQRNMDPNYAYFANIEPVFTVEIEGVTIWEVYEPNQMPLPDSIQSS